MVLSLSGPFPSLEATLSANSPVTCGLPDDLLTSEFAASLMELLNHHGVDVSLGLAMWHVAFHNSLVLLFHTAYKEHLIMARV